MIKIVGNCPKCGAPIYWDTQLGEGVPANIRTCNCLYNVPVAYPADPVVPKNPMNPLCGDPTYNTGGVAANTDSGNTMQTKDSII